jgi:hypothetical protein
MELTAQTYGLPDDRVKTGQQALTARCSRLMSSESRLPSMIVRGGIGARGRDD